MAVTWRQPSSSAGGTTGVTIPAVPGIQNGDLLVAFCLAIENNSNGFRSPSVAWVKWADVPVQLGAQWMMLSIFSKLASGEPSSWTFTAGAVASFGAVVAIFDDGGSAVDVDLVTSQVTASSVSSFNAPQIVPNGTVDPYALVLACWASASAMTLPAIGGTLFNGQASSARIVASVYPAQKGVASAPAATNSSASVWISAQIAVKALAKSGQRRMLRSISPAGSATIPVPANLRAGDTMIAFARSTSGVLAAPSGWTTVAISDDQLYAIYSHTASAAGSTVWSIAFGDMPTLLTGGSGEPATYTFTNSAEGLIVAFFDMDGSTLSIDTTAVAVTSGNSMLFTSPTVVTGRHNELLLSHFASEGGTLVGPYGQLDAGGSHRDYATQSESNNLLSWATQGPGGLTAARTAYSGIIATWRAAQVGISGPGHKFPL